jgi:hypothetical protein
MNASCSKKLDCGEIGDPNECGGDGSAEIMSLSIVAGDGGAVLLYTDVLAELMCPNPDRSGYGLHADDGEGAGTTFG